MKTNTMKQMPELNEPLATEHVKRILTIYFGASTIQVNIGMPDNQMDKPASDNKTHYSLCAGRRSLRKYSFVY